MDVCKSKMEGEQGKTDLGNGLKKCVSGVIQTTLKAREGEERTSQLKVVWFGVNNFWQKRNIFKQKQILPGTQ